MEGWAYQAAGLLDEHDALVEVLLQPDGGIGTAGTATNNGDIADNDVREPAAGDDGGGGEQATGEPEDSHGGCESRNRR